MKLLNKLLNKFGYMLIKTYWVDFLMRRNHALAIVKNPDSRKYIISKNGATYEVGCIYYRDKYYSGASEIDLNENLEEYVPIKEFATDDADYNKLCAQELLDELNKEI